MNKIFGHSSAAMWSQNTKAMHEAGTVRMCCCHGAGCQSVRCWLWCGHSGSDELVVWPLLGPLPRDSSTALLQAERQNNQKDGII